MQRQNPYVILGVSENATRKDILEALKYNISVFCDNDGNGKDANGDYYQQLFWENAQMLLDPVKRKEIDDYLRNTRANNSLVPYTSSSLPSTTSEFITYVNREVFNNNTFSKYSLDEDESDKRCAFLEKRYALIGEDGSFIFGWEESSGNFFTRTSRCYYYLIDSFTKQVLTDKQYRLKDAPWRCGKPFDIGGVKTLAVPGSKVVPVDKIFIVDNRSGISLGNLKAIQKSVTEAISNRPEVIRGIFEKYKDDNSYKKLGKNYSIR